MRRTIWPLAALAAGLVATTSSAQFSFTEVSAEAGIRFDYERDPFVPIGGGGTWLDYDGDGWYDLYMTQTRGANRLFRNEGDGTFSEVLGAAGAGDPGGWSHGAVAADYDNDGDADIFVSNLNQNRLFQNRLVDSGAPGFVDVTALAGMGQDGDANSASATWGDYDGDGLLDLYVGNHVSEWRPGGIPNLSTPNYLWHNQGDGTFVNVAKELGVDNGAPNTRDGYFTQPGTTLATTWSDYDNDGDLDLFVVNDFGMNVHPNQLFRNDGPDGEGGWTFTDISVEIGFDSRIFGMGIAVGDPDNDGDLDYYASHGAENVFMKNRLDEGLELFDEIAAAAGVQANDPEIYGPGMGPISWGVEFADFDRDGWEDLLVVNGWIEGAAGMSMPMQPSYIFHNNGDLTFTELHATAGLGSHEMSGKSSGMADYDRDGDIDFFIGNMFRWNDIEETYETSYPFLYRNDTGDDHSWLAITAIGTVGNRDSVGARLMVTTGELTQQREIGTARSFLASGALEQMFGLGDATEVDELTVRWLSGLELTLRDVAVDQRMELSEPTLTIDSSLSSDTVPRGGSVDVSLQLTNQLDLAQSGEIWLDHVAPDGTVTTLRQSPIALGPGVTRGGVLPLVIAPQIPLGDNTLVLRYGTYPDTVVHQTYNDLTVTE